MAQVTYFTTSRLAVSDVLQLGAMRTSFSASAVVWTNPDGSRVVGTGTDFAFDELGAIISGTLARIDRFDASGTELLVRFDLAGAELWLFEAAWSAGGVPYNPILGGDDTITGGAGDDELAGFAGSDTIDGGDGLDVVTYLVEDIGLGVVVDLGAQTGQIGGATDTLVSIEGVTGTMYGDELAAGSTPLTAGAAWRLDGQAGDDLLAFPADVRGLAEPGAGADVIQVSNGSVTWGDSTREAGPLAGHGVEISYADAAGPFGTNFNYYLGWIVDPFGDIDSLSAAMRGARMTARDDSFLGSELGEYVAGLDGADTIDGGYGYDTVRHDLDALYGGTDGVIVDLASGYARDGFGATDSFYSIEHVVGTNQPGSALPGGLGHPGGQ